MVWYNKADQSVKGNNSGEYTGGPPKGLLHSTEGASASGAIGAFRTNNSWPHFLVDYTGKVWQFIDTNKAARALRNLAGGVETNRDHVIQIEIVGFAGKPNEHPLAQWNSLRELMRWIEVTEGVLPKGPPLPFASRYNQPGTRMSPVMWDAYGGWLGHSHAPENLHWDPGAIDLQSLLPFTPIPLEEAPVAAVYDRNQGGYVVLKYADGGIFAYDAPFFGSLPGLNIATKVAGLAWTPAGDGYWILGADGAVFSFGAGQYKGGFNALPPEVRGNRVPIGIIAKGNGYVIVAQNPDGGSPFSSYEFGV